jgi:hypothetical protein
MNQPATERMYYMATNHRYSFRPYEIALVVGACIASSTGNPCLEVEYADGTRDLAVIGDECMLGRRNTLEEKIKERLG